MLLEDVTFLTLFMCATLKHAAVHSWCCYMSGKSGLLQLVFKKGRPFLNVHVFELYKYIPVPHLIPSRSLSLTKQPGTLTGGGSSRTNNVLMKVGAVTCRAKAACSNSFSKKGALI